MKHLYTLRDLLEALLILAAMVAVVLQPHPADSMPLAAAMQHPVAKVGHLR